MRILKNRILTIQSLFIILVALAALVVFLMFSDNMGVLAGANIFALWGMFTLAGLGLVVMVYKVQLSGKIRISLLACGYAAAGFLAGIVLHNLFYALASMTASPFLSGLLGFLEGAFFILAVIICPLALLAGILGTLVLWKNIPTGK
jgi:hypothetical protein